MEISTKRKDGEEFLVVDEDPGMREEYERLTGNKFPETLTYQSTLDGHLQSWWKMSEKAKRFMERQRIEGLKADPSSM